MSAPILEYSDQEYEQLLQRLDPAWTRSETDYLWSLCSQFDQRFVVIHDRYDPVYGRTIEDLKKRYYDVCHALAQARHLKNCPFYSYQYDSQYEKSRKLQLEKYLLRAKDKNEEEKALLDELKKVDAIIRKEEREQHNLRKALNLDEPAPLLEEADEQQYDKVTQEIQQFKESSLKVAYLRSSLVHASLPFS